MIKPLFIAIPALAATALGFLFSKPAKAASEPEPKPEGGDTPAEPPLPGGGGGAPAWTQEPEPAGAPGSYPTAEPSPAPGMPPSGLWPQSPVDWNPGNAQPSPGFPPMQLPGTTPASTTPTGKAPASAPASAPADIPTQVAQAAAAAPGLPQIAAGSRTLKLTSPVTKGSDVMALQVMLNGSGAKPALKLDGAYGPGTVAAVKKYQASRKLTADGVTGKSTWASLLSQVPAQATAVATQAATTTAQAATIAPNLPSHTPGSRTLRQTTPATKGTDVLALQVMLNASGANPPLSLDGAYGPAAARAVRIYQASRKLTADGVVGQSTWRSLLSAVPKTAAPSSTPTAVTTAADTKAATAAAAAAATVASATLPAFAPGSRTLKSTKTPMRGTDVLALQVLLNEAGASPQLKLDGSYGPSTLAAVKKYQAAHQLLVDGQVGANTWSALRKTGGAAAPEPPKAVTLPTTVSAQGLAAIVPGSRTLKLTSPPMSGADVLAAQTLLNKAGASPALTLDGKYGSGSAAAVKKYQKAKGLTADGILGATTWTSLKKYDAPAPQAQKVPQAPTPVATPAPSTTRAPANLPVFALGSRTIRQKSPLMKGSDVWELQGMLNRVGYSPALVLDGVFGPAGVKAVRWFQSARHLTIDGVAGPATISALRSAVDNAQAPAAPPATVTRAVQQTAAAVAPVVTRAAAQAPAIPALPSIPGLPQHPVGSRTIRQASPAMKGTDVLMLQASLNAAGANPPLVLDGAYGPAGVAAVKAYQVKNRLAADGVVGPATWAVLQGGSVGAILEDPLREAAMELSAHLRSIGGIDGIGREDKSLVQAYQRAEGIRSDGMYSPGDAARILKHGVVPVAPFYWADDDTARNKQRDVFLAQVLKGQQLNPPQASLYEKLRSDTIKLLGEVSK